MKKALLGLLLLASLLLPYVPVSAAPTFPDPDVQLPTITSVDIYNNYAELGDMLVVANYYMKYTTGNLTLMTLTIDQTFVGRMLDSTGVEVNNVAPYPYYSKGYEHGIFAMYFPAALPPPAWGGAHTVELNGDAFITWTGGPNPPTCSTPTLSWHSTTTVAATSLLLGINVLFWATTLGNHWSVVLTSQTASGTKLSSYGDQYFSNAIPGLRAACPQIYSEGVVILEPVEEITHAEDILRPNAIGDLTQFTPVGAANNWDCVDEAVPDEGATYVTSNVASKTDLYNLSATVIPADATIRSVTLYSRCVRQGVANYAGYIGLKTGGTEYWGNLRTFTAAYTNYHQVYALNPSTGSAWTIADVNALQVGVKTAATTPGVNCTQTYVEVAYDTLLHPYTGVWPWDITDSNIKGAMFGIILLIVIYFVGMAAGRMDLGMFSAIILVPVGIRLGMIDQTIGILIAIVCALVIGFTLILQKGAT